MHRYMDHELFQTISFSQRRNHADYFNNGPVYILSRVRELNLNSSMKQLYSDVYEIISMHA